MVTASQFGRGKRVARERKEFATDENGNKLLHEGDQDFTMRCKHCSTSPVRFPTKVCFKCFDLGLK